MRAAATTGVQFIALVSLPAVATSRIFAIPSDSPLTFSLLSIIIEPSESVAGEFCPPLSGKFLQAGKCGENPQQQPLP